MNGASQLVRAASVAQPRAWTSPTAAVLTAKAGRLLLMSVGFAASCMAAAQTEPAPHGARTMQDPAPFEQAVASSDPGKSVRGWHAREGLRYRRNWGVDIVGVRVVSSGYMLAFRYRVLDADKAKALSAKTSRPYLIDEATGIRFAVPAMENVGELRQSVAPETGQTYFMVFGNPGKVVKPGSRVSVVIGNFQADGLVVQ